MSRVLLLVALLLAALPAAAHETTRSYLTLDRDGAEVTAELRLAFRDIEVVVWMDEDLDGRITWGEARRRLDAAASYASARLEVGAGGACPLTYRDAGASESGGIAYLDLAFTATCPDAAAALSIATTLFTEIDPDHRLFVTATANGASASAMVGTDGAPVPLAEDGARESTFLDFFLAGIDHLLQGADHLAFLLVLILPAVALVRDQTRRAVIGVLTAVTGFTLAHALTLTAAATELLRPPGALIETLIAVSILLTAADNLKPFLPGSRAAVAAFFGTIHGFGFATALAGQSASGADFAVALLGFNLGIEAAQVLFVLVTIPALAVLGGGRVTVWVGSLAAGALATVWIWQRVPALLSLA